MSAVPPAIIFVNNDLTDPVLEHFVRQLYIDDVIFVQDNSVIDGYADGYRNSDQRVMFVVNYEGLTDRSAADVCLFYKNGLVHILKNKFGPFQDIYPLLRITWHQLGVNADNHSIF